MINTTRQLTKYKCTETTTTEQALAVAVHEVGVSAAVADGRLDLRQLVLVDKLQLTVTHSVAVNHDELGRFSVDLVPPLNRV